MAHVPITFWFNAYSIVELFFLYYFCREDFWIGRTFLFCEGLVFNFMSPRVVGERLLKLGLRLDSHEADPRRKSCMQDD